jgi:hypothetical protein
MSLPASGSISMSQIAAELSIGSGGLNLNDSRVRGLAGIGSGTISFSSLRGKSNVQPLTATSSGTDGSAISASGGGVVTGSVTANPSGSTGSYTYAWVIISGNASLVDASSQTCSVTGSYAKLQSYIRNISLQCTVTSGSTSVVTTIGIKLVVDNLQ